MKIEKPYDISTILHDLFISDDEEMISAVASHCHIVTKEKGDTIWAPGATEDSTTILLDGVVKTFILSPNGTENTMTFWFKPGTFICPTKEMINIPEIWCVALTQCTLIEMVGTSPYKMAEDIPVLWKEIILGTLPFAVRIMEKARVGYTMDAKDRYLWFLDTFRPIADIIPQNEIALYLGIQPQSLSRIRAELAEEGTELTPPRKINN